MSREQLAARLLSIFLIELEEQLDVLNAELLALERDPRDAARLGSVFRVVHTLKGAAHAAHVREVEELSHTLESLLARAREGHLVLGSEDFTLLFTAADALADARGRLVSGGDLGDSSLLKLLERLRSGSGEPGPAPLPVIPGTAEAESLPAAPASLSPTPVTEGEQVRVKAEKLDALLSASSQLLVTTARMASRPAQLEELYLAADQWGAAWDRSARRLRIALEGTENWAAFQHSLDVAQQDFRQLVRDASRIAAVAREDARVLSQTTQDMGDRIRRLRLRPFADACIALPRAVRDLATASGKEVRLVIEGGGVDADRAVINLLHEALLQLVRNAVDHGIETSSERVLAGKPPHGTVTVLAALQGNRLLVTVTDDGRGVDRAAVAGELARRGLEPPATDEDLTQALLRAGFSTRSEATSISGRGVGLDVVATAIERARGSIQMDSSPGRGTTFTLECAPSLATVHALLVALGSQTLVIPSSHVGRIELVQPDSVRRADGRDVLLTPDGPVPLVSLAALLGPPFRVDPVSGPFPVVRLVAGGRSLAVAVDGLVGVEEIVMRPIEGVGVSSSLVGGATLLGTGRAAVVLNGAAIVTEGLFSRSAGVGLGQAPTTVPTRSRILVADDSITTRTLEQSILEAAGYDVLTAVDGSDAWRILHERGCDLLVSDVEMPRMDGIELCAAVRASPRLAGLPVVLVTALDAPEHRERGLQAGADAYLPKSTFDHEDLLDTIQQLLG